MWLPGVFIYIYHRKTNGTHESGLEIGHMDAKKKVLLDSWHGLLHLHVLLINITKRGGWNHMVVSKNRGTPKWMVYNGKSYIKWMIWGYPYFRKHPYHFNYLSRWCLVTGPKKTCDHLEISILKLKGCRYFIISTAHPLFNWCNYDFLFNILLGTSEPNLFLRRLKKFCLVVSTHLKKY